MVALASGELQAMTATIGSVIPFLSGNRLRALGVTSAVRLKQFPDIPALAEGVPGYEFSAWVGVLAPSTTPPALVAAINGYWVKAARSPEVVSRLTHDGNEVVAGTPAEFAALIKAELPRWNKVIRDSGIKPE